MDILIIIGILIIGFYSGWNSREAYAQHKMSQLLDKINSQIDEEEREEYLIISIEKHNDILFCYDKKTNAFLTQANSKVELEQNLAKMFPGKKFYASKENLNEIGS